MANSSPNTSHENNAATSSDSDHNANADFALSAGATLDKGRYVIEKVLGRGGFGLTYCCHDYAQHCTVAVKEFLPQGCGRDEQQVLPPPLVSWQQFEEARERFLQEFAALSRLQHPSIVRAHDCFQENQTAYLVMEFLQGESITKYVETHGPLDESTALRVVEQVGSALTLAHAQQTLHRDVNPDNIILSEEDRAVLIDFGAAGKTAQELSYTTMRFTAAAQFGTPGYAPIEQYGRQSRRGPYTDVYGLAATLYFMLSGEAPPPASDRILGTQLKALDQSISRRVSAAVEYGLAIDIEGRAATVEHLIDALHGKITLPARSQSSTPLISTAPTPATATNPILGPISYNSRTPSWLKLALGFAGLMLTVLVVQTNQFRINTPPPLWESPPSVTQPTSQPPVAEPFQVQPPVPTFDNTPIPLQKPNIASTEPRQNVALRDWDRGLRVDPAFSKDGSHVASGQQSGVIRVWDVRSGEVRKRLQGETLWGYRVAFSPDGKLLAAAGDRPSFTSDTREDDLKSHGNIAVWEWKTGKKLWQESFRENIDSLAFSPDGTMLGATRGEESVHVWHPSSGRKLHTTAITAMDLAHSIGTEMLRFSPDSKQLATCHGDRTVRLRNARSGGDERILQGHTDFVWALAYSPDGKTLASAGGNLILWSPKQATRLKVTSMAGESANFVAFSPDGKRLVQTFSAESDEKQVSIRDTRTGDLKQVLSLTEADSSHIGFTPDSRSMFGLNVISGQLHIWSMQ